MTGARTGRFGLAMGGGSVRGLAHIGVLQVLEENDLHPSWLAGTSAGSITAGLMAFGVSPEEMERASTRFEWETISKLRPFAPIGALTNEGLEELCAELVGDVLIEDAEIPLVIVATDINTGERVTMTDGPLGAAMRASSCLPGLYMPVDIGGRALVDGFLVEDVPVLAARELGADIVVAVSLGLDLPFAEVRNTAQVMIHALEIAVNANTRRQLMEAEVLIEPEVSQFAKLRARDRSQIIEAGRRSAERALPRIREALAQHRARRSPNSAV